MGLAGIVQHSIQQDRKIKKICEPLVDALGISIFTYYVIEEDGRLGTLSTCPDQLGYYYEQELWKDNAYMADPNKLRDGFALIPAIGIPDQQEFSSQQFSVDALLLKLEKREGRLEGFIFATPKMTLAKGTLLLPHLDALTQFSHHFRAETKESFKKMREQGYNLRDAKGDQFYDTTASLLTTDCKHQQWVKSISRLTEREQQCLEFLKRGKSARATAAYLGLSPRTVEYYFENIKNKLGLNSKFDLLDL